MYSAKMHCRAVKHAAIWILCASLVGCGQGKLTERNLKKALVAEYNDVSFAPCAGGKNVFDIQNVEFTNPEIVANRKKQDSAGINMQVVLPADVYVPTLDDIKLLLAAKAYGLAAAAELADGAVNQDAVCNMVRFYLLYPCLVSRDPDVRNKQDLVARAGEVFYGFNQFFGVTENGGPNGELLIKRHNRISIVDRGPGYQNEAFKGLRPEPGYSDAYAEKKRREAGLKYLCS